MTRRHIIDGAHDYTIAPEEPLRLDLLPWGVLRTRVLDELTQQPPLSPITLTSNIAPPSAPDDRRARSFTARVAEGGFCGIVARPRDAAYALITPGAFRARVTSPGYLPRDLTPAIETARRALAIGVGAGNPLLQVQPPETAGRPQFREGRGVMVERPLPTMAEDEFTTVAPSGVPPGPADVPLANGLAITRLAGTSVAGVPMVLPDQYLHRDATFRLRGRIQRRINATTVAPAAGASFGILGIWFDYPSSSTTPPQLPALCAVEPTLRAPHPVGAAIDTVTVAPAGASRRLRALAPAESREIALQPTAGLNAVGGDRLVIGDPLVREYETVVTAGFDPAADPGVATRVRLLNPLGYLHRPGELVRQAAVAPPAIVFNSVVAREALIGDAVVFGPGLQGFPQPSTIGIDVGGTTEAFYRVTLFPTIAGTVYTNQIAIDAATGRFEWPPIARVAQLRVVIDLGAIHHQRDIAIDYGSDNAIAIVLT